VNFVENEGKIIEELSEEEEELLENVGRDEL